MLVVDRGDFRSGGVNGGDFQSGGVRGGDFRTQPFPAGGLGRCKPLSWVRGRTPEANSFWQQSIENWLKIGSLGRRVYISNPKRRSLVGGHSNVTQRFSFQEIRLHPTPRNASNVVPLHLRNAFFQKM